MRFRLPGRLFLAWWLGLVNVPAQTPASATPDANPFAGEVLEFLSGDLLRGTFVSLDERGLRWRHASTGQLLTVKTHSLHKVRLAGTNPPPAATGDCLVRLHNGDELRGKLAALDAEALSLHTWFAGELKFARSSVASLVTGLTRFKVLFDGPHSFDGWTYTPGVNTESRLVIINGVVQRQQLETNPGNLPNGWHYHNGAFYGLNGGTLGRALNLPPLSNIEFDLAWRNNLNLAIAFYTDTIAAFGGNGYVLQFSYRTASLRRNTSTGQSMVLGSLDLPEKTQRLRVAIRSDLPNKTLSLFFNDSLVRQWVDVSNFDGLGGSLALILLGGQQTVKISNLRVCEWDGRLDNLPPLNVAPKDDVVRLVNNDRLAGRVQKIAGNQLTIKTDFAELELPLDRVTGVDFASPNPDAALQAASPGDVRAYLRSGDRLTFRIERWESQKVLASGPHFKTAVFQPAAFQYLHFNPSQKKWDADTFDAPLRYRVSPEILMDDF